MRDGIELRVRGDDFVVRVEFTGVAGGAHFFLSSDQARQLADDLLAEADRSEEEGEA